MKNETVKSVENLVEVSNNNSEKDTNFLSTTFGGIEEKLMNLSNIGSVPKSTLKAVIRNKRKKR